MNNKNKTERELKSMRLDKWLWAARFYKTRSIAKTMVESGKVHYNNHRAKPSKMISLGAIVKLRQGNDEKVVTIIALAEQRKGAAEAQLLYKETAESIEQREKNAQLRKLNAFYNPNPQKRPDKKQRRDLLKLKQSNRTPLGD